MKKIVAVGLCALSFGLADGKFQEKSGVLVGLSMGAGQTSQTITVAGESSKTTQFLPAFGLQVGYKHFFNEYLGVRGYGAFDYAWNSSESTYSQGTESSSTSAMNVTANADVLFNAFNTQSTSYGVFVGIGLGGQFYNFKLSQAGSSEKLNQSGFYADAKLGLRAATESLGIEFGLKFPFTTVSGKNVAFGQDTFESIKAKQSVPQFYATINLYF
ncbi:hypothetical protein CQA49_07645 [Helicobacter sp. MIT 00-7814]|uniref:outer membrane beta-barrel protein n=1 Tax=unclassified Helicobacter TaxID=2593540 RepID=UPI000E1F947B|nr:MULTISPECIES: outer membrane beta-barrel protein [unclassified Helicobacter]RDU52838.1 hypothetical protein CQA49_07645 [Helicobacter sp. MIT 00-7814]RDU55994.1 hypothetical protein CQA37_02815 [Helicobacter sp. MIT 99-10781]